MQLLQTTGTNRRSNQRPGCWSAWSPPPRLAASAATLAAATAPGATRAIECLSRTRAPVSSSKMARALVAGAVWAGPEALRTRARVLPLDGAAGG